MRTIKCKALLLSVIMLAMFASCEDESVIASFTPSETAIGTGETITFSNESENASYYQWDFGDGDISVDSNPTHEYSIAGTFEVTLVAIGDGGSDSTTVTITVTASYDITIFEGEGIENVDVYDTWSQIQEVYPSTDTLHYIYTDYLEDYGFYLHEIYFYEEGVIFDFLTEGTTVGSTDPVYYIWVVDPFSGATSKGISIGSDMEDVVDRYGDPESENESSGYTSYWYDTQGIDFYDDGYGTVDLICIYEAYESSSYTTAKSAEVNVPLKKELVQELIDKRKMSK